MKFFYTTEKIDYESTTNIGGDIIPIEYHLDPIPVGAKEVSNDLIYFTTKEDIQTIAKAVDSGGMDGCLYELDEVSGLPPKIEHGSSYEEIIKPIVKEGKKEISVGIVNISCGFGDTINQFTALNVLYNKLLDHFDKVYFDLYQLLPGRVLPLDIQEPCIRDIYPTPARVIHLENNDFYIDFSDFASDKDFVDSMNMTDYFLTRIGVDFKKVPPTDKRPLVKINERIERECEPIFEAITNGRPALIFHHEATGAVRSIPPRELKGVVQTLLDNTDYMVLATGKDVECNKVRKIEDKRFVHIHDLVKGNFDKLTYFISRASAVVSVDTCIYHIAASFNIPTVVLFSTIEPKNRIKYYPYVEGILMSKKGDKIYGKHNSFLTNDLYHLRRIWQKFDQSKIIKSLNKMEEKVKKVKYHPCPICKIKNEELITDRYRNYKMIRCKDCDTEFCLPRKSYSYDESYKKGKRDVSDYNPYFQFPKKGGEVELVKNMGRLDVANHFIENIARKKKSLDVGCANGFYVGYLKHLGFDAYGTDISKLIIDHGKKELGLNNLAVCGDLKKLPKSFPKKYDLITSFELVEHLIDPNLFARNIYSLLNKGGYWIFGTPNRNRIYYKIGFKNTKKHIGLDGGDYPPEHLQRLTLKGHEALAERNKFEMVQQKSSFLHPNVIEGALEKLMPNFDFVIDGNKIGSGSREKFRNYLIPFLDCIEDGGLFITTIAKKV